MRFVLGLSFFMLFAFGPLHAGQTMPGPYDFKVLKVHDGDTFHARVPIWLGQEVFVKIRLADVDTPEIKGKCAAENELAQKARQFTEKWVAQPNLKLVNVRYGTYAGRVVATVQTPEGETLAQALLAANLAKPYRGRRATWCGTN
jgi:endonuclease YncB( thermonuclease family)